MSDSVLHVQLRSATTGQKVINIAAKTGQTATAFGKPPNKTLPDR
jgi:hypothetical protein